MKRTPKQRAEAKGKRLELMVKAWLESSGGRVELAPKVARWLPGSDGVRRPRTMRHDFFGVWDGVVVTPRRRYFIQVTTLNHVATKREKIIASGFPVTIYDQVLGYEGRRKWRVLHGPDFGMPGVTMTSPPQPRAALRPGRVVGNTPPRGAASHDSE